MFVGGLIAKMTYRQWAAVCFALATALLITHELDAVNHHEWRVLPLLNGLTDPTGYDLFLLAHIPFFFLMVWILAAGSPSARMRLTWIICGFCIVHGVLHWAFSGHDAYEFEGVISLSIITGAAVAGAAYSHQLSTRLTRLFRRSIQPRAMSCTD